MAISVRQSSPFAWLHRRNRPTPTPPSAMRRVALPPAAYTANPDRWAILPGEYDDACIPAPRPVTFTLAHPGTSATIPCAADGAAAVHLGGAWRGRVVFEGSADGSVWRPIALLPLAGDAPTTEATRPGLWRTLPQQSPRFLRLRMCDLAVGTVAVAVTSLPAIGETTHADALDRAA